MSTKQVHGWLEETFDDLARVLAPTDDGTATREAVVHAMHRLYDARPALPGAQAFDADRVSGGGSSSKPPPGFDQRDTAQSDRDEAHRRAKRMRDDADWFVRMVVRTNPRQPSPKDRELTAINERGEPGCQHCATVGMWSPVHVAASTAKGTLPEPIAMCRACYRHVLKYGALPTRRQLEDARDKGAWKESA